MTSKPWRIHWGFVPVAIVSAAALWGRLGPAVALLTVLGGLSFGVYIEHRARSRRNDAP
jgi:hypothetical protein